MGLVGLIRSKPAAKPAANRNVGQLDLSATAILEKARK